MQSARGAAVGLLLTVAAGGACSSSSGDEASATRNAGGGAGSPSTGKAGASGGGGSAGAKPHACPTGLPGPELVEVKGPDGTPYCIDATEVTQAHYAEFLKAKGGDLSGQVPECDGAPWEPDMEADEKVGGCPKALYDPVKFPGRPMDCAPWCMARGYCEWAGKRLCRRIGGGTITTMDESGTTDPQGEWYNACSQGGKTVYPYGDTLDPDKCASTLNKAVVASPDGKFVAPLDATDPAIAGCHGSEPPFDKIANMSGNALEWEDSCFPDPYHPPPGVAMLCRVRGGQMVFAGGDSKKWLTCGDEGVASIRTTMLGIRCCAD